MKVIFLDIDGVLQPYKSQLRFTVKDEEFIRRLGELYHYDYSKYCSCDVAACYLDWHPIALDLIKKILRETDAKIVISSSWRAKENDWEPSEKMYDFLKLHNLDAYYYGET